VYSFKKIADDMPDCDIALEDFTYDEIWTDILGDKFDALRYFNRDINRSDTDMAEIIYEVNYKNIQTFKAIHDERDVRIFVPSNGVWEEQKDKLKSVFKWVYDFRKFIHDDLTRWIKGVFSSERTRLRSLKSKDTPLKWTKMG
jgi:hypothetical protein